MGEIPAPVAGLDPGAGFHPGPGIHPDIVRVDERYEQAERLVELARAVLQELDDALAADAGGLPAVGGVAPADVASVVVRAGAAQRAKPVEFAERSALPFLNGVAGVRRIPAGPTPILLHDFDIGRSPVFAAVAHRRVGGVAQVPLAFPDHLVAGLFTQQ